MATVWKATQRGAGSFERPVALKRIKPDFERDETFVEMFIEEARVGASLVHPNIVQIHDFGVDQDLYYLAMEWIEGLSLSQLLHALHGQQILPAWHVIAAIAIEACRGLAAAHARIGADGTPAPVYHRDVTPQNILLGLGGYVKLTDFGLARAADRARITAPDIVKGKVGYLAPELTRARQPTRQSDIYALGVVLWQALAGRRLFPGDNDIDIFVAASNSDIPPLSDIRPDVPPQLVSIIERALARDPADRFESSDQLGRVIANLLRRSNQRTDPELIASNVAEAYRYLSGPKTP